MLSSIKQKSRTIPERYCPASQLLFSGGNYADSHNRKNYHYLAINCSNYNRRHHDQTKIFPALPHLSDDDKLQDESNETLIHPGSWNVQGCNTLSKWGR